MSIVKCPVCEKVITKNNKTKIKGYCTVSCFLLGLFNKETVELFGEKEMEKFRITKDSWRLKKKGAKHVGTKRKRTQTKTTDTMPDMSDKAKVALVKDSGT